MHRDKKLGLALGILLVGIVGALFFRNDSAPTDGAPALQDPDELDRSIAEKGTQLWPARDQSAPTLVGTIETEAGKPPQAPAPDAWSLRPADGDAGTGAPLPRSPGPPDPIRVTPGEETGRAPLLIPEHNSAWDAPGNPPPGRPAAPAAAPPADSLRTHLVRPGDTLSGLAIRYLGSSLRFREIYLANQDLLKSPDDLRVGLALRIPPRDAVVETPTPASRTAGDRERPGVEARPVSSANTADEKPGQDGGTPQSPPATAEPGSPRTPRFVPVPRSPLTPRRGVEAGDSGAKAEMR